MLTDVPYGLFGRCMAVTAEASLYNVAVSSPFPHSSGKPQFVRQCVRNHLPKILSRPPKRHAGDRQRETQRSRLTIFLRRDTKSAAAKLLIDDRGQDLSDVLEKLLSGGIKGQSSDPDRSMGTLRSDFVKSEFQLAVGPFSHLA